VMAGQVKPPIADRAFAERLMGLYVGPTPIQEDIKAGVVARLGEVPAAGGTMQASGTVQSVAPNGFTMTDSSGKAWSFTVDKSTSIVSRGASHEMAKLKADGKAPTVAEFIAAKQAVDVKYQEAEGKLVAREIRVK